MRMVKKWWLMVLLVGGIVSCSAVSESEKQETVTENRGISSSVSMTTSASSGAMVKLVEAFDHEHNYRGYARERRFVIRVKNIAYQKNVFVRQKLTNGAWENYTARYVAPAGNGWETWECSLRSVSDNVNEMAEEFVIGYTVSGQTYWDNNAEQNYRLARNAGPLLGKSVMVAAVYLYKSGNGAVDVRNIAYTKDVTIVYTTNNWVTTLTAKASYAGPRVHYGYSTFDNPNIHGTERWYFFLPSFQGQTVQYAVKYTVNGQTYWDNNEGANYTVR